MSVSSRWETGGWFGLKWLPGGRQLTCRPLCSPAPNRAILQGRRASSRPAAASSSHSTPQRSRVLRGTSATALHRNGTPAAFGIRSVKFSSSHIEKGRKGRARLTFRMYST